MIFGKDHKIYQDAHCSNSGIYCLSLFAALMKNRLMNHKKTKKQTNPWLDMPHSDIKNSISVSSFFIKSAVRQKRWKVRPQNRTQLVRGEKEHFLSISSALWLKGQRSRRTEPLGALDTVGTSSNAGETRANTVYIPVRHLEDSYIGMSQPSGFGGILVLSLKHLPLVILSSTFCLINHHK